MLPTDGTPVGSGGAGSTSATFTVASFVVPDGARVKVYQGFGNSAQVIDSVVVDPGGANEQTLSLITEEIGIGGQTCSVHAFVSLPMAAGTYDIVVTRAASTAINFVVAAEAITDAQTGPSWIGTPVTDDQTDTDPDLDVDATADSLPKVVVLYKDPSSTFTADSSPVVEDFREHSSASGTGQIRMVILHSAGSGTLSIGGTLSASERWLALGFDQRGIPLVTADGGITPAGALLKEPLKVLAGAITPTGALTAIKVAVLTVAGALTPVGALVRSVTKILAGALTPAGVTLKEPLKVLSGGMTPTGAFSGIKVAILTIAGALTPAGALVHTAIKSLAGALTPAGALVKNPTRLLAGALTPSGALSAIKVAVKAIAGSLTPSGGVVKTPLKVLAGALTPVGALVRNVTKILSGALTPVGVFVQVGAAVVYGLTARLVLRAGVGATAAVKGALSAVSRLFPH